MWDVLKNLLMLGHNKILVQINAQSLSDANLFLNLKPHAELSNYLKKLNRENLYGFYFDEGIDLFL